MPRAMTSAEIADLLSRNFSLDVRVKAHRLLVASGGWTQIDDPNAGIGLFSLPIAPAGFGFVDDKFGNVVLFPDAAGELHYSTDVPAGVLAQTNLPPYESPAGNSISETLADFKALGGKLLGAAVLVAVIVGGVWAVSKRA